MLPFGTQIDGSFHSRIRSPSKGGASPHRPADPGGSRHSLGNGIPGASPGAGSASSPYSDRFIPTRTRDLTEAYSLLAELPGDPSDADEERSDGGDEENSREREDRAQNAEEMEAEDARQNYSQLLRNEFLGDIATPGAGAGGSPSRAGTGASSSGGAHRPRVSSVSARRGSHGAGSSPARVGNNVVSSPSRGPSGSIPGVRVSGVGSASSSTNPLPLPLSGSSSAVVAGVEGGSGDTGSPNLFRFLSPQRRTPVSPARRVAGLVGGETEHVLAPKKTVRKIPRQPFKVLDAPSLQDDFYLNLVDWSAQNVLAVGLDTSVYLWSAYTSRVTKLCDVGPRNPVSSVGWLSKGNEIAVGTGNGKVLVWDATTLKMVRQFSGHTARVGSLAANSHLLSSGGRDKLILHRDMRSSEDYVARLVGHRQEVCGLRWAHNDIHLASGGNDNMLHVWNQGYSTPIMQFSQHTAAVKALAWSPHQHGLLASGGGTADRCIRIWNTSLASTGNVDAANLTTIDTGSQVCNLAWSKSVNEIVSTHGYSQNQIVVWKYPSMSPIATLTGHTLRVLYLAVSPTGETIVTGAGDETLRFFNIWPKAKGDGARAGGILESPHASIR